MPLADDVIRLKELMAARCRQHHTFTSELLAANYDAIDDLARELAGSEGSVYLTAEQVGLLLIPVGFALSQVMAQQLVDDIRESKAPLN